MGNIYWLASYPKSGNTWMRILLTNYFRNADRPADINSLDGGPIASARQVFDDHVGIEASDLTQDEIERYRPFVYELMSAQATEPLFLKVHDAYTYTPYGYPLISKVATAGVIYLLRNPLDVAVSFAHHANSSVERMVGKMGEADYAFVDNPHRLHNQLRQRLLTWSGHVSSWWTNPVCGCWWCATRICRPTLWQRLPACCASASWTTIRRASRRPWSSRASSRRANRKRSTASAKRCPAPKLSFAKGRWAHGAKNWRRNWPRS